MHRRDTALERGETVRVYVPFEEQPPRGFSLADRVIRLGRALFLEEQGVSPLRRWKSRAPYRPRAPVEVAWDEWVEPPKGTGVYEGFQQNGATYTCRSVEAVEREGVWHWAIEIEREK